MATLNFESRVSSATGDVYTLDYNTTTEVLTMSKTTAAGVNSNVEFKTSNKVEAITADTTLTAADSGTTYLLDAVGEVITLPALADGLNFKFRAIAATTTTDWTIVSSTDVIEGYAAVNYATVIAANENTISLVATKAIIGDTVEVFCDGTSWHVSGYASVAAALTFTAP